MAGEARSKGPLFVAILVAVGLVVGVRLVTSGSDDGGGGGDLPGHGAAPAGDCTALGVTASSEKAALLSGIAEDYNRAGREAGGHCVRVTVTSKASGGAT